MNNRRFRFFIQFSNLIVVCSPILLVLLKRRSELRLAASADDPDDFVSLQLLLSDGFWQLIRKIDLCLSHAMDRVTIVSIHGNPREQPHGNPRHSGLG